MAGWKNAEAKKIGQRKGLLRGSKQKVDAENFYEPGIDFRIAERAEAMKDEAASHKRGLFGKIADLKDRFSYWSSGGGSKMDMKKRNWLADGAEGSWRQKKALKQAYNDVSSGYEWSKQDVENEAKKDIINNNEAFQKGGDTSRMIDPRYTSLFLDKPGMSSFVAGTYASVAGPILEAFDQGKITEAEKDDMIQSVAENVHKNYEVESQARAATEVAETTKANSSGLLPKDNLMLMRYFETHFDELPGTTAEKKAAAMQILGISGDKMSTKYQELLRNMVRGVSDEANDHVATLAANNAKGFAKKSDSFKKRTGIQIGGLGDD